MPLFFKIELDRLRVRGFDSISDLFIYCTLGLCFKSTESSLNLTDFFRDRFDFTSAMISDDFYCLRRLAREFLGENALISADIGLFLFALLSPVLSLV